MDEANPVSQSRTLPEADHGHATELHYYDDGDVRRPQGPRTGKNLAIAAAVHRLCEACWQRVFGIGGKAKLKLVRVQRESFSINFSPSSYGLQ